MAESAPQKLVLALDWLPNTNHLGFYVAKARGLYKAKGLEVELLATNAPEYKASYIEGGEDAPYVTPSNKVANRSAHFALNSPEGVVNWNTREDVQLTCVAACLQRNTSAIVTLKDSGLDRPKLLDGKKYASYGARFEGRIVQKLIQADGGKGVFEEVVSPMLGIWDTLLKGNSDATWVFMGWEGIEAKRRGVELNVFQLEDYGIPYGYAPCLLTHPALLTENPAAVRAFLAASAEGWALACKDPAAAAADLVQLAKAENDVDLDLGMCVESAEYIATKALPEGVGPWGRMDPQVWESYLAWLDEAGLLTKNLNSRKPGAADVEVEASVATAATATGASGTAGTTGFTTAQKVSLDDLRNGTGQGARILLSEIPPVFSNAFLPEAT